MATEVGETTIVSILEEVLVVEKRLVLKEELHIRRRQVEMRDPRRVTLRSEEVTIERLGAQETQATVEDRPQLAASE